MVHKVHEVLAEGGSRMWYRLFVTYLLGFEALIAALYGLDQLRRNPYVRRICRALWSQTPSKHKIRA